ncbi:MAG: ThiF family adenylyltransferase [bacterium]|nr:ThiF family adenylyltransferase [bacterium]
MRLMNFDQQVHVFDPTLARPLTIIGAGQVGSQLAMAVAKMGCTDVCVWDDDVVASHNPPASEYRKCDILRPKVEALAEIIREATGVEMVTCNRRYTGEPLNTAVASCVDGMDERKTIWERVKRNPLVGFFVDTRVAEEYIEVFAIETCNPEDIAFYEAFLYPSKEALTPFCGRHGAKHVGGTAAYAACAALTQWWKSCRPKRHLKMLCGHFQEV